MHSLSRRVGGLLAAALTVTLAAYAMSARAQFPEKPIRMVVPYPPGGGTDMLARGLAAEMSKDLGRAVVVENKPGANTKIATISVANAPADGHTVLMASSASMVLNPLLYRKPGYSPQAFRTLAIVAEAPLVIVTNPQVPAKDLKEFAAFAKANAGRVNFASVGLGNPLHLATELLMSELKLDVTHVPYNGSMPALTSLVANDTQLMFDVLATSVPMIRSGRLNALAVTTEQRLKALPEVPTVSESAVPDFRAATWFGIAVPSATPRSVGDRLQAAVHKAMSDPRFREIVDQMSFVAQAPRSDAQITQYVDRDRAVWGKVIQERRIVLEDASN